MMSESTRNPSQLSRALSSPSRSSPLWNYGRNNHHGHKGMDPAKVRRLLPSQLAEMDLPSGCCSKGGEVCVLCDQIRCFQTLLVIKSGLERDWMRHC